MAAVPRGLTWHLQLSPLPAFIRLRPRAWCAGRLFNLTFKHRGWSYDPSLTNDRPTVNRATINFCFCAGN
ncbi:hypothetical protein FKM82_001782 [Ascaphus truei]